MSTEREEILITRVLDETASVEDWDELEGRAAESPDVWARLARALRAEAELRRSVGAAVSVADRIDLPDARVPAAAAAPRSGAARRALLAASGWAAAAVVALAWWSAPPGAGSSPDTAEAPVESAIRTGDAPEFLGELPRIVVDAYPPECGEGALEVVYVRQLVERTRLRDVYEIGRTEHGDPVPLPIPPEVLARPRSL